MIWDGREVNKLCGPADYYKMETLKKLRYLCRKNDWLISADLQDGFFALGIYPEHTKYMSFQVHLPSWPSARTYSYQVCPFGWCESPRRFLKLTEVLVRALRNPDVPALVKALGCAPARVKAAAVLAPPRRKVCGVRQTGLVCAQSMRLLPYMDDFLACFSTREEALAGGLQLKKTCAWLGLSLSATKCHWEPTQTLDHLGLRI